LRALIGSLIAHMCAIALFWESKPLPLRTFRIQVVYASTETEPLRLPAVSVPSPAPAASRATSPEDDPGFRRSAAIPQPVPVASVADEPVSDGVAIPSDIGRSLEAGASLESSGPSTLPDRLVAIPRLEVQAPIVPEALPPEVVRTDPPGRTLEQARLVKQTMPVYPPTARTARVQGVVVLEAEITETGTLDNVTVIDGHPMLVPAAIEAVRKWRYVPARIGGVPVKSSLRVTVRFRLDFN